MNRSLWTDKKRAAWRRYYAVRAWWGRHSWLIYAITAYSLIGLLFWLLAWPEAFASAASAVRG